MGIEEKNFNWKVQIKKWVKRATKNLDKMDQIVLRYHADKLVDQGGLRGDVSEMWVKRWPHLKSRLEDLYL